MYGIYIWYIYGIYEKAFENQLTYMKHILNIFKHISTYMNNM